MWKSCSVARRRSTLFIWGNYLFISLLIKIFIDIILQDYCQKRAKHLIYFNINKIITKPKLIVLITTK